MIKNYLKIAWRNLKKQPFFTFLNVFGLAVGMAGGLLISLYIYDELSFDKMFADADRIHRINVDIKFGGEEIILPEVSAPMALAIEKDYPQIELITRFRNRNSLSIRKSGTELNVKETKTAYADDTFFDMFGIDLLVGNPKTALKEPNSIVLTKTAAEKHFKVTEALGQSVIVNNNEPYIVTGVMDDPPKNSFLREHTIFMAMSGNEQIKSDSWSNNNYATFIKLMPNAKIEDFQVYLESVFGKYFIPFAQQYYPGITEESFLAAGNYFKFSTIPLTDIRLHSNRYPEFSPNGSIQNVYILSFIAIFLIVLASVNFMNLSTAHSLKRAKEVGIRKTLGSHKISLVKQFLTESGLISFISLLMSLIIASITMPYFNELAGKVIFIPYTNPFFWLILLLSTVLLGLFSGLYPAFFMSRFTPSKVLKGTGKNSSTGDENIRNLLVVFQFSISVFLIVGTLVVFQQLKFIQGKDLGYTKDQVLVIDDVYAAGSQAKSFKEDVLQLGQVENATLSGFLPTPSNRSDSSYFVDGVIDQDNAVQLQQWKVDYDYIKTLDLEILAGRDFDRNKRTDSLGMIINEAAVATLGVAPEKALGMRVSSDVGVDNPRFYTIIGVVNNFHFKSLRENVGALSLTIGNYSNAMAVKLHAGDVANTIAKIEEKWKKVAPGQPFNYYFMEDSFNHTYEAEQRLGKIFSIFTTLSILIACLGLF